MLNERSGRALRSREKYRTTKKEWAALVLMAAVYGLMLGAGFPGVGG